MSRRYPQAIAWLFVLSGFVCFCLLSAGIGWAAYWFVFESPVPLSANITVSRGSVRLQTPNDQIIVNNAHRIDMQTGITVDDESQSILTFVDTKSGDTVVALTLMAGSHITVRSAERPRFNVSRGGYTIALADYAGQLTVNSTPGTRAFQMSVGTQAGTAQLTAAGRYTLSTDHDLNGQAQQFHVFNQGGVAWLILPTMREQQVWPNKIGSAATGSDLIEMADSAYTLLISGLFQSSQPVADQALPDGWQCVSGADSGEPSGQFERYHDAQDPADYGALHLWRIGSQLHHGETSCLIYPAGRDGWLNATPYQSLRLHMRLKLTTKPELHIPDVPACGIQASECPIMIEITWTSDLSNPQSALQQWHHGFYSLADATYPLTCDTCRLAHEHVNSDVWYVYDSGDLRSQFPTDKPLYIEQLSVYASGHQYDARIGEITLSGDLPASSPGS